jgi:hypothetical protein
MAGNGETGSRVLHLKTLTEPGLGRCSELHLFAINQILLRQDLDVGASDETLGADPATLPQERAALAPVGPCRITLLSTS